MSELLFNEAVERTKAVGGSPATFYTAIGFGFVPRTSSGLEEGNFYLVAETTGGQLAVADTGTMALLAAAFSPQSQQVVSFNLLPGGNMIDRIVVSGYYGKPAG